MSRSKLEIAQIKEELKLAYEAYFGVKDPKLSDELTWQFHQILDEMKLTFLKRKIGHLFESGRTDYTDFVNLFKLVLEEGNPTLAPVVKEETVLPNGIVKKRVRQR